MTDELLTRARFQEAANFISARSSYRPSVGLITGSGLAGLADSVSTPDRIPYFEIPHFPVATVLGHPGELVLGELEGRQVVIMRGRVHFYEGYSMQQLTLPVRVMRELGVAVLIITNAAGGINPAFQTGDIMCIKDHLNLVGMAGFNPLRGPNDPELGPRFPLMAGAYDPGLRRLAHQVAADLGFTLQEGVYVMLAGPTFETPTDLRFLRMVGVDAVGMSTVPEVIVARHGGMRVLGLSLISNVADPDLMERELPTGLEVHEEVLTAGEEAVPRLEALIRGVIRRLDEA